MAGQVTFAINLFVKGDAILIMPTVTSLVNVFATLNGVEKIVSNVKPIGIVPIRIKIQTAKWLMSAFVSTKMKLTAHL